jgi:hypothetical protein
MAIVTEVIPDRALLDSLRATLGEVGLFFAFGQECIETGRWAM